MPQLNGEWRLMREGGKDVSGKKIAPWVITDDEIRTFDKRGSASDLKITYFKVDKTLFMDIMAGDPDHTKVNMYWTLHAYPMHSVCKVILGKDTIELIPLNYEWMDKGLRENKVSLPHIRLEDERHIIFTARPDEWLPFLKKYRDDKNAFNEKMKYVLKRM